MSRTFAVAVCALCACSGSGGGLEIVVPSAPGVTSVRLYFGVGAGDARSIAPESTSSPIRTTWWALDKHASLDVRTAGTSEVTFELVRGDETQTAVAVAIVVGFDGNGEPVAAGKLDDLMVPTDFVASYRIALTSLTNNADLVVQTWPKEDDTCVWYADFATPDIDMVTLGDNMDCDRFTDADPVECLANVYESRGSSAPDNASCLAPQRVTTANGEIVDACTLGAPRCLDGEGPDSASCHPTSMCTPRTLCIACQADASSFECAANVTSRFAPNDTLPTHFECAVGTDEAGILCSDELTFHPNAILSATGTTVPFTCSETRLSVGAAFDTTVTRTTASGAVTLEIGDDSSCAVTLRPSGTMAATEVATFLAATKLSTGRGVALPIVINVDPFRDCGTAVLCDPSVRNEELLHECVTTPLP